MVSGHMIPGKLPAGGGVFSRAQMATLPRSIPVLQQEVRQVSRKRHIAVNEINTRSQQIVTSAWLTSGGKGLR